MSCSHPPKNPTASASGPTARWLAPGLILLLGACASGPAPDSASNATARIAGSEWAVASVSEASGAPTQPWRHQDFPGKRATDYQPTRIDGRPVVAARSRASASVLRQDVRVEPADLGRLRFSWKVPALIEAADLDDRDLSDSPVRVVLAFEGDRSRFSARDAMLSELAHALTGEPMPYATLMYVWSNHHPPGTVIHNGRTSRIRKLVVESGPGKLNRWLDYERDVRADFEKAFGEAPGALLSIGIMTDSDNTRSAANAWYGPLRHVRVSKATP